MLARLLPGLRSSSSSAPFLHRRAMATIRSTLPHEARTASSPRQNRLEPVILSDVRRVNASVRLLRLNAVDPNRAIPVGKFSPGQWLDTFIPGLQSAGGFTITSAPGQAVPSREAPPFLELAVQKSANPAARWLWRPEEDILGARLVVRVGGSFVWPPLQPGLEASQIERLVLVAGGVGVNPLVSIMSHLVRTSQRPREVHFLYATRADSSLDPQGILFLPRLQDLVAAEADPNVTLSLFVTGTEHGNVIEHGKLPNRTFGRRIAEDDLIQAIDGYHGRRGERITVGREKTVCYVCGPPQMTDELVAFLRKQDGMSEDRVLCEKWW